MKPNHHAHAIGRRGLRALYFAVIGFFLLAGCSGFAIDEDEQETKWVGLTCAACHMGEVTYQGTSIFIAGGPGMLDFTAFEHSVMDALVAQARGVMNRVMRIASRVMRDCRWV